MLGQKLESAGTDNVVSQSTQAYESIYSQPVAQFLGRQSQEYVRSFLAQSANKCCRNMSTSVSLRSGPSSPLSVSSVPSPVTNHSKSNSFLLNTDGLGFPLNLSSPASPVSIHSVAKLLHNSSHSINSTGINFESLNQLTGFGKNQLINQLPSESDLSPNSESNSLRTLLQESSSNQNSTLSNQLFHFINRINTASSSLINSQSNDNILNQSQIKSINLNQNPFTNLLNSSGQGLKFISVPSVFDFFNFNSRKNEHHD